MSGVEGAAATTVRNPAHASAFHSPATPMATLQVSADALGDDREQSEGDAMEVCSEHGAPPSEPTGERLTYTYRSAVGIAEVLNMCFKGRILGLTLGKTDAGWLQRGLQRELGAC